MSQYSRGYRNRDVDTRPFAIYSFKYRSNSKYTTVRVRHIIGLTMPHRYTQESWFDSPDTKPTSGDPFGGQACRRLIGGGAPRIGPEAAGKSEQTTMRYTFFDDAIQAERKRAQAVIKAENEVKVEGTGTIKAENEIKVEGRVKLEPGIKREEDDGFEVLATTPVKKAKTGFRQGEVVDLLD